MPDWEQMVTVGVADAWRVVRKEVFPCNIILSSNNLSFLQVAKELFPGLLPVPHLLQADYYDLMVCFTKCQGGGKMSFSSHPKIYILTFFGNFGSECTILKEKSEMSKIVIIIMGGTSNTTGH